MATIALPVEVLTFNAPTPSVPMSTGTAIDSANTYEIPFYEDGKVIVFVQNTFAGTKNAYVRKGATEFPASGQGDLTIALAQNEVKAVVLSSDRFKGSNGKATLEFESGTTGFIRAYKLP